MDTSSSLSSPLTPSNIPTVTSSDKTYKNSTMYSPQTLEMGTKMLKYPNKVTSKVEERLIRIHWSKEYIAWESKKQKDGYNKGK